METTDTGLPAGVVDAVLNRGELAQALNRSENTITAWVTAGMPVLRQGTNGSAYEFQLSDCWRWLKQRERAEEERTSQAQLAVQQMRLALIGGNDLADQDRLLSPRERQEAYDAERSFMLTALQRGDLVRRHEVVELLELVLGAVKDPLTALPDKLERELGLSGKAIDLAITVCDGVLSDIEHRLTDLADGDSGMKQAAE